MSVAKGNSAILFICLWFPAVTDTIGTLDMSIEVWVHCYLFVIGIIWWDFEFILYNGTRDDIIYLLIQLLCQPS